MRAILNNSPFTQTHFQSLFESVPELYLVLSPDLYIVAVTDAYAQAIMTKREDLLGKAFFEVFPDNPGDASANGMSNLKASLYRVLENKTSDIMPVQKYDMRRPDGKSELRYWRPKNQPVFGSNDEVSFIMHRVEDITDFMLLQEAGPVKDRLNPDLNKRAALLEEDIYRSVQQMHQLNKELEQKVAERTEQLEAVNKTISDYKFALDESSIVAVTDQKGIIKNVNDNFCKISKYSRKELLGQDHRIINSGHHSKAFIRQLWVTIASGRIWKGEMKNRAKDGTIYWVDTTIVPFLNDKGKPYQYVAIRSDITQRKEAEQEILKLNDELEDKVKERTLELTQSLEREKALNDLKSRFVSMASHEFRTPLSSILSSVSLLEKYTDPEHADKRNKHFTRVKDSVRNLTGILEDFLSLDKLEQGKTEVMPERVDLREFGEQVKGQVEGMLKEGQSVHFSCTGNTIIVVDKKILRNILFNLLSNAIKYSPEEKTISLYSEVSDKTIRIRVKDEGIGIPEEEQKNMFRTFFRAKNAELIQGTGLGLTIVKRYIELLGGNISFTSVVNQGTTFNIEFPNNSES